MMHSFHAVDAAFLKTGNPIRYGIFPRRPNHPRKPPHPSLRHPRPKPQPKVKTPPSVHLHIDRVILDGFLFTTGGATRIRAALDTELLGILGESFFGMPRKSVALDTLPASQFPSEAAAPPASLGRELATTLGTSLSESFPAPPSASLQ